jgi:hypothetical protein
MIEAGLAATGMQVLWRERWRPSLRQLKSGHFHRAATKTQ